MKKREKQLLTALSVVALLGAGGFGLGLLLNPPPSPETVALEAAGNAYGEKGHDSTKALLRAISKDIGGEIDTSDEAQKHLYGKAQGCILEDSYGGQWKISAWVKNASGDLGDLGRKLKGQNDTFTVETQNSEKLYLRAFPSQSIEVTKVKGKEDTYEVLLTSPCYGA